MLAAGKQSNLEQFWQELNQTSNSIKWVRYSAPWLEKAGVNQVQVLPPPNLGLAPKRLPTDLLKVYWHCRTNLPVYPAVNQAWEIYNEPEFYFIRYNPDLMAAVLKAAYWGIKHQNPKTQVLMPSMTFAPDKYLSALLENNFQSFTDGYNFHYYGWIQDFVPTLLLHRRFISHHQLHLPVWLTEAGYFSLLQTNSTDLRELAKQRAFHERLCIEAFAYGVNYYFPFVLDNWMDEGHDLGMSDPDLSPRPALLSYLQLTHTLPDSTPVRELIHRPTHDRVGLAFRTPAGKMRLVLWSPYRPNDFNLPDELSGHPAHQSSFTSDNTNQNSTVNPPDAFSFELSFPSPSHEIEMGWGADEIVFPAMAQAHFQADSTHNVYLSVPALPKIQDCYWRSLAHSSAHSTQLSSKFSSHGELLHALTARKTLSVPKQASPVVVQLKLNEGDVLSNKDTQSYLYEEGSPVGGQLYLYNLSSFDQTVNWRLYSGSGTNQRINSRKAPSPQSFVPQQGQIVITSFSCHTIPFSLDPSQLTGDRQWLRALAKTKTGASDFCQIGIEANHKAFHLLRELKGSAWRANPDKPDQWTVSNTGQSKILKLSELPPPGRAASFYWRLPADLKLHPDLWIQGRLKMVKPGTRAYARINLLTSDKIAYRYGNEILVTDQGVTLNWRLGDFGHSLWSRERSDYRLQWSAIRYLRLTMDRMAFQDEIEVDSWEIMEEIGKRSIW